MLTDERRKKKTLFGNDTRSTPAPVNEYSYEKRIFSDGASVKDEYICANPVIAEKRKVSLCTKY